MNYISLDHLYTVDGYLTFFVVVKSGSFSGASNFCLSEAKLRETSLILNDLYKKLSGACQINDYDSDDFISFEFLKLGHLKITGQLGGSYNPQYLRFQFISEQTVLQSIITTFNTVLQKSDNNYSGIE